MDSNNLTSSQVILVGILLIYGISEKKITKTKLFLYRSRSKKRECTCELYELAFVFASRRFNTLIYHKAIERGRDKVLWNSKNLRAVNIYLIMCRCCIVVKRPNLHDRYPGRFVFPNGPVLIKISKIWNIVIYVQYFNFNHSCSGTSITIDYRNSNRMLGDRFVIERSIEL